MREILFKAKRKNWQELPKEKWWIKWYMLGGEDNLSTTQVEIDPETLCQYTGLTDENGKRIWENDIVAYTDMTSTESGYWEQGCVGEVRWSEEELCFYVTNRLYAESWEVLQECNVIGNIFDNPELLEED